MTLTRRMLLWALMKIQSLIQNLNLLLLSLNLNKTPRPFIG